MIVGVYGSDIGSFVSVYSDHIVVIYCETGIDLQWLECGCDDY